MTVSHTALHLDHVSRVHSLLAAPVIALRDVTLTIPHGSFTAIMGPSGSGKSTLLHCASGLDQPTGGRVIVAGTDVSSLSESQTTEFRRRRIGFVFQSYNLIKHLSVKENIQLPLWLDGQPIDPAWIAYLLSAVGLEGVQDRRPAELSGGQAQRVAIARALVARPAIVLADEPTGALDRRTGDNILNVLREASNTLDQTLVMVTHDPHAASFADRVVFLADGQIAGDMPGGNAAQISTALVGLDR